MRLRVLVLLFAGALLSSGLFAATTLTGEEPAAGGGFAAEQPSAEGAAAVRRPSPPPEPAPTPTSTPEATPTPTPAPTPTPEPAPTPEPPAEDAEPVTHPDLALRIAALLTDADLPGDERVAVSVVDEAGRALFEHHADVALLPASTQKLVTAAAALATFPGDHRFRTEVRATAVPDADGVVDGDLVLVGGGDPALATPTFATHVNPQRPRTPLEGLADRIEAAGVRHVRGRLLGDGTLFTNEPEAPGWTPRYLERGDTVRSTGLTVNAGRRLFVSGGTWHSKPAPNPASEAAAALTFLLRDRGIEVEGGPAGTGQPPETPHLVASIDSPTLQELLRYTVQRSDNHMADTVFRALGALDEDGSWSSAGRAAHAALQVPDLPWAGAVLADGSGLSRLDRLSARLLTSLDVAMTRSSAGAQWQDLMAVSSRSGTLRRRLHGTVAEARVRGKTGTLRDVRALSGTVVGPDERRYHFAVIGNGLDATEIAAVRALQDELVVALAEDLYGCVWVPVPQPTPEPGQEVDADAPPVETELRCAA